MGNSNWNAGAYAVHANNVHGATQQQVFTNTAGCHDDLNPAKFKVRESRDSAANPLSTPVIIGVDETGSMGHLAVGIIKTQLGIIMQGIYDRKPVTDPHVILLGLGDAYSDHAPIQATQFEADMKLVEQISKIFIESNGGGNGGESYPLAWWLARHKTSCDCQEKRGKRGYLFTIGDEAPHPVITKDQVKRFFDVDVESDVKIDDLLREAQARWHVFHLITPTDATKYQGAEAKWKILLGERAIVVDDHTKLGEVIVSIMQVNEGHDADAVAASWGADAGTAIVVKNSLRGLTKLTSKTTKGGLTVV